MNQMIKYLLVVLALLGSVNIHAQYNPTNPAEPGVYYTLTLKCSPDNSGSFNVSNVTTCAQGSNINLRAYTNTSFKFVRWEESGETISTNPSFTYTMGNHNTILIAHYEYDPGNPSEPTQPDLPKYSNLYLSASPSDGGSFSISSGNKYEVGSSVPIRAYANSNFSFKNWTENGEIISTSSSFNYVMKEGNPRLVANFEYTPGSPSEPGIAKLKRRLYLKCNPSEGGYFNISSGNEYEEGSSISLRAYSNQYYTFQNWSKDGEIISENYQFSYLMPSTDTELVANYTYNYNPGNPGEPSKPTDEQLNIYGMTENIVRGQTINYPIFFENNIQVKALIVDVQFAEGFTVDTSRITVSGRGSDHEMTVTDLGENNYRFSLIGEDVISGENGKVFDISITASENLSMGETYPVHLTHGVVHLTDGNQKPITVRDGNIYVEKISEDGLYARFSYDKYQNRVKFTNQSSSNSKRYEWDFGDGTTSTEENPLHKFSSPGYYTVRLTTYGVSDSDVAEQIVLINEESSWTVSGTYYLGESEQGVRYFTSVEDLFNLFNSSRIDGDITVNVAGSLDFIYDLTSNNISVLQSINDVLSANNYTMSFLKNGNGRNPVISYGKPNSSYTTSTIDLIVSLGENQICNGVEMKMWGISFDTYQLHQIRNQEVCSGTKTEPIDFSLISPDMTFSWSLNNAPGSEISGYIASGTRSIPSMNVVNEGLGNVDLNYTVTASYSGKEFYTFPVRLTIRPALVGMFTALEPKDGAKFENTDITLTWNNITNAVFDVYAWNATNEDPTEPIVANSTDLRYNLSKFCQNGNAYKWYVVAHNECQTVVSDTLSFSIEALPDLHVSSLELSEAIAGKEMTVKWTVVNDGSGSTGRSEWIDYIWMVPDVYVGTSTSAYMEGGRETIKMLKSVPNVKALEPGESYENSVKVNLEERVYGNYYIIVAADMYDIKNIRWQVVNNTVQEPYTPSATGTPYPYLYGETSASYNVVYEKDETTSFSDNFFYKKIEIAVPELVDLTVPAISSEVDNTPGTTTTNMGVIRVTPTPHTTCGLAESKEFYSGKYFKTTATIKNAGGLKLEETSFRSVLYISHSANREDGELIAVATETSVKPTLSPDGTVNVTFSGQIPWEWYGDTYFHVLADIDDNVYEMASKQNNWGVSDKIDVKLTPCADFEPKNLKIPESISSQVPFNISYDVKNIGPNIPFNSAWSDKIYISKKSEFDESAQLVATVSHGGHFSYTVMGNPGGFVLVPAKDYSYSGDNYSVNQSVKISDVTSDKYYVFVKVDANNQVFEYDGEDNNILVAGPITCVKPDLEVELVSISADTIATNTPVAFTWKLKNAGTGVIKDLKVTDAFYASVNQDGADASLLGTVDNVLFLEPGAERTFKANITIPQRSYLNGVQYVYMRTNYNNNIQETSSTNNTSAISKKIFEYAEEPKPAVVKGTNIAVTNVTVPSSVKPGETVTISYNIRNNGDRKVETDLEQEIFMSSDYSFDAAKATKCNIVSKTGSTLNLGAEASTSFTMNVEIPANLIGGRKYLFVYADRANTLKEKNVADNYSRKEVRLDGNLPRIEVRNIQLADTIMSSEKVKVSWTTSNTGEWNAGAFRVGVYKSENDTWDYSDELLASVPVSYLAKGATQTLSTTFSIPDKNAGKWNIILMADYENKITELVPNKATISRPVVVSQSPLPDLTVKSVSVDGVAWSGQSLKISATFANEGDHATRQARWSEDYYLSQSTTLNTQSAIKVASRTHNGILAIGESYTSTINVTLPPDNEGNYMIFVVVDGGNAICEKDENNISKSLATFVNGRNSRASDLTITKISSNSRITAGADFTVSYTITNRGEYAATGLCRDVIYLSKDNVWDSEDIMVGTVSGNVDIESGNSIERDATGRITNVVEGDYYLIIKTNSTRSIAETDDTNNFGIQSSKSHLTFADISIGGSVNLKTSGLYKLNIPNGYENKTVGFYLDHDVDVSGGLYVAYENVPSTAVYDKSSTIVRAEQQEVLMANVQAGNYYILAQDNASVIGADNFAFSLDGAKKQDKTSMNLSTKEVHFGATSLSINQGGTGGWLSSEIKGALLDSIMDFRLVSNDHVIPVEQLNFKSTTSSKVTFNLNNAETGVYDVVSELPDGTKATLPNGFTVVPGTSVGLEVKLEVPGTVRLNAFTPVSLTYFNNGTTDAEIYELMVTIDHGGIAASYEELERTTEKTFHIRPEYETNRRGFVSIPPGTKQVVNFFINTGNVASNNVTVYIVK